MDIKNLKFSAEEMKQLFNSTLRYLTAISSDKLVARECLK